MDIQTKQRDLTMLYKDLERGQKDMLAGKLGADGAGELEQKAKLAEELQEEIDTYNRVSKVVAQGRVVDDVVLPASGARRMKSNGGRSPGEMFAASEEYKDYLREGTPTGMPSRKMVLDSLIGAKAAVSLGAGVIAVDRDRDVVRTPEMDRLTIRDVLSRGTTSSNAVEFVIADPGTHAAAPVAEGAVKPEAAIALTIATAPVRTIAVTSPISEQSLQDAGFVKNIIDTELTYQLGLEEERQFMWGSGAGQNLQGILTLGGVPSLTRTGATQNIDRVMQMVTDVSMAGYSPNALAIHPLDWEGIVLLKGTTSEYLWGMVTDSRTGAQRLWGLNVVVTPAAKAPAATTRNMLVGDFVRGATLWDRQLATIEVGFVNDQFIRNLRTIRAEERLAFSVKRPTAFVKYETAA